MPTANYDSSELTRRIKARALGGYATSLAAARLTNPLVVSREQNASVTLDVVTQRLQGTCVCVDSFVRENVPQVNYTGPQGSS